MGRTWGDSDDQIGDVRCDAAVRADWSILSDQVAFSPSIRREKRLCIMKLF
jgi:hypothetical protein